MKDLIVVDCEVYPNYFLAAFQNIDTGKVIKIEARGEHSLLSDANRRSLRTIMKTRHTFGFNSNNYDIPIICYALKGHTCEQICKLSNWIIGRNAPAWMTMREFDLKHDFKHFDISEPSPGVKISLKLYGGRIHSQQLQDLPIEPNTHLTEEEMDATADYCQNDLRTTIDLYRAVEDRIGLRAEMSERYALDLMSKSDAQIAEAVIRAELERSTRRIFKRPEVADGTTYRYNVPEFIHFTTPQLKEALQIIRNHDFELDNRGSIKLPKELKQMKINLGSSTYQLGVGGLHSTEKRQAIVPTDKQILADRDVASYYPNIILNLGLYPKHLGPKFLEVYRAIVDERLAAKAKGDKLTADSLKITINGSFGKLGSKYSMLYSPDLMMTVTLTGQLALLMLIERLEISDISVVSANTDGFVSLLDVEQYDLYDTLCFDWELQTGFELEETRYRGLFSRDVNNYLALTDKGYKGKGVFAAPGLMKNPQAPIVARAVAEYKSNGTPVDVTIRNCKEIEPFLTVRSVTGGAMWRGQYLGRVVRWAYTTDGEQITYKKNGNKVAKSDGATPIMRLSGLPTTLDYQTYINEANDLLEDIGCVSTSSN